ncbi:TPA: hypothetical protein DEG21_02235 [Patescibacteria group bacterium]|nr:hypothetical protein [Candidatus Gracilibacteria bacterium]
MKSFLFCLRLVLASIFTSHHSILHIATFTLEAPISSAIKLSYSKTLLILNDIFPKSKLLFYRHYSKEVKKTILILIIFS